MRDSNFPHNAREKNEYTQARSKNVATLQDSHASDPDLAAVIEAWAELSGSVKAAIVALVKAANIST